MPSLSAEMTRRKTAKTRVLAALMAAGERGCTNVELCQPSIGGMRFGGRVFELGEAGWDIAATRERGGVWRYTFKGRKQPVQADLWGAA